MFSRSRRRSSSTTGINKPVGQCDQAIEGALARLCATSTPPADPLPAPRHTTRGPNALAFDVRPVLYKLVGVDLTQIHGLGPYNALKQVSECGTDMFQWPTSKHFTSWLTLAPGNKISGGRILSTKTRRLATREGSVVPRCYGDAAAATCLVLSPARDGDLDRADSIIKTLNTILDCTKVLADIPMQRQDQRADAHTGPNDRPHQHAKGDPLFSAHVVHYTLDRRAVESVRMAARRNERPLETGGSCIRGCDGVHGGHYRHPGTEEGAHVSWSDGTVDEIHRSTGAGLLLLQLDRRTR